MMKKWTVLMLFLMTSLIMAGSKIAITTKVLGKAEVKRSAPDAEYVNLKPGTVLENGDYIRTGANGFAALIFIDDKSALKVRNNTEVEISGKRSATTIAKKVNMEAGTVRAKIKKQKKTEFTIQTPTSVASVKGTDFWFVSDPQSGDQLFGMEGVVSLTNIISGLTQDVTAGLTGVSLLDGSLMIEQSNPSNIPVDPEETEEGSTSTLRIEFEDENGTIKTLVIEYQ
ncbi:MAG: FecR domain-containing protein [Fidelibacterota bacterium]